MNNKIDSAGGAKVNEPFGDSEQLRQAAAGFLSASFYPDGDGYTDEMRQTYSYWHKRLLAELQPTGAMEYVQAEAEANTPQPAEGDGAVTTLDVEDACDLDSIACRLTHIQNGRWPAKDWDVSDRFVAANIGHAKKAAEWSLPAINRIRGKLADLLTGHTRPAATAVVPERRAPVQRYHAKTIPWRVHGLAWEAYAKEYGTSQTAERLAERGGFGLAEMDKFLPGWRDMAHAIDHPAAPAAPKGGVVDEAEAAYLQSLGDDPALDGWYPEPLPNRKQADPPRANACATFLRDFIAEYEEHEEDEWSAAWQGLADRARALATGEQP